MVIQNKALICAAEVLINSQHASNLHANKQLYLIIVRISP